MRKNGWITFVCLSLIAGSTFFLSCQKEPQETQAAMIQLENEDLQPYNITTYKTRKFRGRERTYLTFDFTYLKKPESIDNFNKKFHFPPIRQFWTGTCWSFATTSFLESELWRLKKEKVKLSEMHTVYWEYVEKARHFIRKKGDSSLGQGSEHNAVILRMKEYGAVRNSDYTGLLGDKTEHNHRELFQEIKNYLDFCKENEYWDETKSINYVKSILNKHLGKPPEIIEVNGKKITPKEYMENILELPLDDYICFMSTKSIPFYTKGEYKVPDNWWHSEEYHNIPLDDFYNAIKNAITKGYTLALGGDVSEPGLNGSEDVAIVPSFDIPQKLINQDSREYRFYNRSSSDDHAIHVVGYKEQDNHTWFLIKDSGSGAQRGDVKGYYYYRDDYIKLKMLTFIVHKDAMKELLTKFSE
ncbi:MAG: C1 family peptidase [Candidatus Aminicenantaceae bacterium]